MSNPQKGTLKNLSEMPAKKSHHTFLRFLKAKYLQPRRWLMFTALAPVCEALLQDYPTYQAELQALRVPLQNLDYAEVESHLAAFIDKTTASAGSL